MNLALAASQLFSKLEGRIWKRGRESGRERKGNSSRNEGGWKRGRAGVRGRDGKWRGREGLVQYHQSQERRVPRKGLDVS